MRRGSERENIRLKNKKKEIILSFSTSPGSMQSLNAKVKGDS